MSSRTSPELSFQQRIDALRKTKMENTKEKQKALGYLDFDDHAIILAPPEKRKIAEVINGSGVAMKDALLNDFNIKPNHPSGGFFGPKSCGENFGELLNMHPAYIDPMSSLAGAYMVNFMSYREPFWNPDFDFSFLHQEQNLYKLSHGIGAVQHFCQDLQIGLDIGWGGILEKIRKYRKVNPDSNDFYDGLEAIVLGMQSWIKRNAAAAREMAGKEKNPQLSKNLTEMADINERLVEGTPKTFREACQWIIWFQMAARMYNGSGSMGWIDNLLLPYYEKDIKDGILTNVEATFHLACLFIRDTAYFQLGGIDEKGKDATNPLSYLGLEAAHWLKIPVNVGVCVGKNVDPQLLRRGVEIMFEDRTGIPKFLGIEQTAEGFARNGYPIEVGRKRVYSGCHWNALPGREYTVNDCVKINIVRVFEVAFKDMMSKKEVTPSINELWKSFEKHLKRSVEVTAMSLDFHMDHMHQVFPELVIDLLCHGPIEKGKDASNGGVEYYNLCIDAAGLATVADSFGALEERIEKEKKLTWDEINTHLESNWAGQEGEKVRLMMFSVPRFGSGGSVADDYAVRVTQSFTKFMKEKPTPKGFNLIPGIFSWAQTIQFGYDVGATPNGRYAKAPISHGPNPAPGFRKDGAPTAMAVAVAKAQCGYGNASPLHMELDPTIQNQEEGIQKVVSLIKTHFDLGGTQINLNILDKQKLLEAHKDPSKYPDLVVRVTGFSAFFSSLSPEMRQMVVDRVISES